MTHDIRDNACPNPTAANNLDGWWSFWGDNVTRLTNLVGPPRSTGASIPIGSNSYAGALSSPRATDAYYGEVWSATGWIRCSEYRTFRMCLGTWADSTTDDFGGGYGYTFYELIPGQWVQINVVATLRDENGTAVSLHTDVSNSGSDATMDLSSVRLERIDDPNLIYADGDTPGWNWSGTVGNSTSEQVPALVFNISSPIDINVSPIDPVTWEIIPNVIGQLDTIDINVTPGDFTATRHYGPFTPIDVTVEPNEVRSGRIFHFDPIDIDIETPDIQILSTDLGPVDINIEIPPVTFAFSVDKSPAQRLFVPTPPAPSTYVIAQSILTGEFIHMELPVENLQISYALSGPTVISGEFGVEIRNIRDIGLEAWGTWIHVEEDGEIRGSGILQPPKVDEYEKLSFEAIGPSAYPHGIPYLEEYSVIYTDPADIFREIWRHIQSYPDGDLGLQVIGATPVRFGMPKIDTEDTVQVVYGTISQRHWDKLLALGYEGDPEDDTEALYPPRVVLDLVLQDKPVPDENDGPYQLVWWEAPDCGSELNNLAAETPFDYVEHSSWNEDKTQINQFIDIGYPRIGRKRHDLRFAQEENLLTAVGPEETDDYYASQVVLIGSGEGRDTIRGYAGSPHPTRLRRVAVVDDPAGVSNVSRANALARAEYLRRQAILDVTEIEIDARDPNARLGSFRCGDDILLTADVPWIGEIAQWERVLSYTYDPALESIRVQLRRSESFVYGSGGSS